MTIALGLMSGTSADGVSAALGDFKNRSFRLLSYQTYPYPKPIQKKILACSRLKVSEISQLNFELGEIFSRAVLKLCRAAKFSPERVAVIGSHGQTIYHGPNDPVPSTFQIGEPAVIALKTGIPVVSDFRTKDIALGGEGAPLIPFFDWYFYGRGPIRALQNIGGIANVTLVGRTLKSPIAFDTGPGNCLIDLAIQKITKGRLSYDPSGKWAARGKVHLSWIEELIRHPYFKKCPPKSTGRELFGESFLKRFLGPQLCRQPFDVLATLTYFTAFTIHEAITRFAPRPIQEIIVSGGGAYNQTLMKHLKTLSAPSAVQSIEAWGIPAQAKEPLAFAFFALRAIRGQINHLPSATGAKHAAVLGKITNP